MKPQLDKKVNQYRSEKARQGNLQAFLAQKRKNIDKLFEQQPVTIEKENDFRIENFTKEIDMKHQKYLEDID